MSAAAATLALIYRAVDELNHDLPAAERLAASPDTSLLGEAGALDSVQLVNLIVTTEELLIEQYERPLSVADDRAFSRARSPFLTIGTFAEYIDELLAVELDAQAND